ncbi:MAG TPA: discoidin domain-containing protein [Polyangiaceae bacterium]|nr:discoidin domain-containing protein [Polyangiaceae bacterium]
MTSKYLKLALVPMAALFAGGCVGAEAGEGGEDEIGALIEPILVAVPARLEAENYERFNESTPTVNSGGKCNRNDGVDMETTTDPNGGNCNVGWTTAGEWLEFDISSPTTRNFNITSRVASANASKTFHVELDGVNLGSLTSPASGWQSYSDRTYSNVSVTAGSHKLRVVFDSGDVNLNYVELTAGSATCTDGIKNGTETGVDCGGSCPACSTGCQSVALSRSAATASSQETAALTPALAIDGNTTTRWSSAFSDPQSIVVDLGASRRVSRVVLRWEAAYSTNYDIDVSASSTGPWTKVYGTTAGDGGVDDISGLTATARYVRMYSRARNKINNVSYGNSLYEFEVYGDNNPNCSSSGPTCSDGIKNGTETDVDCGGATCSKCANSKVCASASDCSSGYCGPNGLCAAAASCTDGVQNGTETGVDCGGSCPACPTNTCGSGALTRAAASASSQETADYGAAKAIDADVTLSRWSSAFSDPQWIAVDLGATRFISRVVLSWEAAASASYDIQVSPNGADPWTTVYSTTAGNGGLDDISGLRSTARYVRMVSRTRTTQWGNSLFDFAVYGDNNPSCTPSTTTDSDGDRLADSVETGTGRFVSSSNTGTSPTNPDSDGDGISDGDEVLGTTAGLNLPAMGVSPVKKNILLEYDWFDDSIDCGAHSHRPTSGAIDRVTSAFAAAPVTNPDGTTGITVIHDYGQGGAFTRGARINDSDGVLGGGFDTEFQNHRAANFDSNRNGYFHYVMLPHYYNTNSNSSGLGEIVGDDMIVSLYCAVSDNNVGNTIMHELGHNLGLNHGGADGDNYKPNYNSVMNYEYQFGGVDTNCSRGGDGLLDYSRGQRASLNENALNELAGMCMSVPLDWDADGVLESSSAADINYDSLRTVLLDSDDWSRLVYDFTPAAGFGFQALQQVAVCDNPAPMP